MQAWDDGATLSLTITNQGSEITGWTLTFSLASNQEVTQGWNGRWEQSGSQVTVRDAGWNAVLAADTSLVVGATVARRKHAHLAPQGFLLNGTACALTSQASSNNNGDNGSHGEG